ncbi:spore germination protein [Acetohalobium arabaticum]|uniref:GerA spore germination protein n=1 Tax=Acetohalobium arabaticum (strain ATCC 49924 / DSM 5501 / Z-7288) TaxID=574087 RepID=D9QT72_ACEAZ|nr:spore germination protein [Acetohalobium arabaticum]ADL13572.1 GerA spore germination protein [Acetohalobium arabaticum DSM 5501]
MFSKLLRKLQFLKTANNSSEEIKPPFNLKPRNTGISKSLAKNYEKISDIFQDASDIVIREFSFGESQQDALLVHIEGMTEKNIINENILGSLMWEAKKTETDKKIEIESIKNSAMNVNDVTEVQTMEKAVEGILGGDTAFFMEGYDIALLMSTRTWEHRSVQKPQTEAKVRGPREGFTETLRVNTSLVRRKIKDPNLKMERMKIGRRTRTDTYLVYIKDIANDKIVEEVRRRLNRIEIDGILESGYIEEFIEDNPLSIFSTIGNTESPDKFAAKILEGRIGILVDGTPFALTIPLLFIEHLQATEDYYSRPFLSTVSRLLRLLALHISLFGPALYVALTSFHPAIIPTPLLVTISAAREGTPFPSFVEVLVMGIIFEILREAGVRLPRPVGQAISIVGGLVLGDAAIKAGLVGAPVIIVVALTGITSFVVPPQADFLALLRIPMIFLAASFGLFGIVWGYIFILIHLASLRSFGVPFMSPLMPFVWQDIKDTFIRAPWWKMNKRPRILRWQNLQRDSVRVKSNLKPSPAQEENGGEDNDQ